MTDKPNDALSPAYFCWLNFAQYKKNASDSLKKYCRHIAPKSGSKVVKTAVKELCCAIRAIFGFEPKIESGGFEGPCVEIKVCSIDGGSGYKIRRLHSENAAKIKITGTDDCGALYGVFRFIFSLGFGKTEDSIDCSASSPNKIRIVQHWDNAGGDIERGYAGNSIFFKDGRITKDTERIRFYARLLASVGINAIALNNVNVFRRETAFITDRCLPDIARIASVFSEYGIRIFLSVNFAAPIRLAGYKTADPLDENVRKWWKDTVDNIYRYIPDFGGFLVKADSESQPGPYSYGRDQADGANMFAKALRPHGGTVLWRCFVYNCHTDWRDRKTDRAKAAFENFAPLDGKFDDNVMLQIKNGPMDFQIREPVTPLFGGLEKTNRMMEFQITQEYTGHQIDLCYLVPLYKEVLDFDTYQKGKNSFVKENISGIAGVSNVGDSPAWTGNPLAQANLFGFGRLAFCPDLSSEEIAREWVKLTFCANEDTEEKVSGMLLHSREIYEKYTAPNGIGWMCRPEIHYGPSIDGYEYSRWGTYHYADKSGIGVDRTTATGTGYAGQYRKEVAEVYENVQTCPENLLLFFHHVPYMYRLKNGKTLIQNFYDTHFEGVHDVENLIRTWKSIEGKIDGQIFTEVERRFELQLKNAVEWRDVFNTYFCRKTGIEDEKGRLIFP